MSGDPSSLSLNSAGPDIARCQGVTSYSLDAGDDVLNSRTENNQPL